MLLGGKPPGGMLLGGKPPWRGIPPVGMLLGGMPLGGGIPRGGIPPGINGGYREGMPPCCCCGGPGMGPPFKGRMLPGKGAGMPGRGGPFITGANEPVVYGPPGAPGGIGPCCAPAYWVPVLLANLEASPIAFSAPKVCKSRSAFKKAYRRAELQ